MLSAASWVLVHIRRKQQASSQCCGFAGMRHRELIADPPLEEGKGFDALIVKYGNGDYATPPAQPPALIAVARRHYPPTQRSHRRYRSGPHSPFGDCPPAGGGSPPRPGVPGHVLPG